MKLVEWLEDGLAVLIDWRDIDGGTGRVHAGLWKLYETLRFSGERAHDDYSAASDVAASLPQGSEIIVIGHSLGGAVGTYLMTALAAILGEGVKGLLFASPKPGDAAYAQYVDQTVGHDNYTVFDYSRDLVPRLPLTLPGLDFARQLAVEWITPATANARIKDGIRCCHHALSYRQMLEYDAATAGDCVLGKNDIEASESSNVE
jgi:pimeloyl-ACP methyl ester carboxylesterase